MKVLCQGCVQFGALAAAQYNAIEPGNGQPGQADGNLITRADIQRLPALQRTDADVFDLPVIELHRGQFKYRSDPPGPADFEVNLADFGQCLGEGVFPGNGPVG